MYLFSNNLRLALIIFFFLPAYLLVAQEEDDKIITAFGINYSDDFTEWGLFGNEDEPSGFLKMRWQVQKDWTEWDFRIGEITGQIKLRSKNDPNIWELRSSGKVLTMKTIYPNDFNQWRITDDTYTIKYSTKYMNIYDGWEMNGSNTGKFEIYTQWEMDPRDWIVNDKATLRVTFPFKIAMVFLSSFYSSPKY